MKKKLKIHKQVFETVFSFQIQGTPIEILVPTPVLPPVPTPTPTPTPTQPPFPPLNIYPGLFAPPVPPEYWGPGIEWVEISIREFRDKASGEGLPGGTVYQLCERNGEIEASADGSVPNQWTTNTSACCGVLGELTVIDETTLLGRYPTALVPLIQIPSGGQEIFKEIWWSAEQTGTGPNTYLRTYQATPSDVYEGDYQPGWYWPIFPLTEVWTYSLITGNPIITS